MSRNRPMARSRSVSPILFSSKYNKAEARKIKLIIPNRRAVDAAIDKSNVKLESNECWKRSLNAAINKPQDNKRTVKDRPLTRTVRQNVDRPHKGTVLYKLDEPDKIQIKRRDGEGKKPVFEYLTPDEAKPSTSASNKKGVRENLSSNHRSRERKREQPSTSRRTVSSSSSSSSTSSSSTSSDESTKKSSSRYKSRSYRSSSPRRRSRSNDRSHRSSTNTSRRRNNEITHGRPISPAQPYFSNTAREHDRIRNKHDRIRSLRSRSRSRERRLEDRRRSEPYPMYPVQPPYFPYGTVVMNPPYLQPAGPRPFFPPPHYIHPPPPGYLQYQHPGYMHPPPFRYGSAQQRGLRPPPPWDMNFRPRYF